MTTTFGRYEILNTIGSGGMATVYRAHDPRFNREVAIKVMSADYAHNQTFAQRFVREAQTVAALEHPAIVSVYDYGEHEGQPFLVMQYMSNGSLADRIERGPLPFEETAHILSRIAKALDWAHSENIIHRDIKPANILFDQHDFPCLADFGIVKLTEATSQLTGSGIVGTPAYMAPEMMDKGGLTHLIDIYALAVTMFQMLTGQQPFEADTPMGVLMAHMNKPIPDIRQLRPDLPDAVQAVIEGGMAKDPMDRYQSAGALAMAFHEALSKTESFAPTPPPAIPEPLPSAVTPHAPTMDIGEDTTLPLVVEVVSPEPAPKPDTTRRSSFPWAWIGGIGVVIVVGVIGLLVLLNGGGQPSETPVPTVAEEPIIAAENTQAPILTSTDRPTDAPTPTKTPEATSIPLGYPGNPVTNNDQWTPVIDEFNGVQMALVPAGCFMMGSTQDEVDAAFDLCEAKRGEGECERDWFVGAQPVHEVCFDEPFWIDVYEVTNEQYGSSEELSGDDLPREEVNWSDALAHCESRGARLPTEAEWEYTARGPDSLVFPWGNDFDGNLVNFCDDKCTNDWADKNVDDGYQHTAPVGSYPGGISWVGAYDLSGNVWEWVNDWYDSGYYARSPEISPRGPGGGEYRVLRGGSWSPDTSHLRASHRGWLPPSARYIDLGFRCVLSYNADF